MPKKNKTRSVRPKGSNCPSVVHQNGFMTQIYSPEETLPRMLTKPEIESLRQDMRRRHEANKKALETMDLSHLMV
ncbi:hypothetical protein VI35_07980 [Aeromonas caviae]|nr:hypothetical protein VI35_07980 [Aeromonas caviae]